jgi:hypothetical protein
MKYLFVLLLAGLMVGCGEDTIEEVDVHDVHNKFNERITNFKNFEISTFGDMVQYVDEFKEILKGLAPNQNWDKTSQVLKKIEGDLPKIPDLEEGRYQNYYANHLAAIPEEGGLRDIATQMLNEARYGGNN